MTEYTEYIGDGVYVVFDGFGFELRANSYSCPTDKIYLEPEVLSALNAFEKRAWKFQGEVRHDYD